MASSGHLLPLVPSAGPSDAHQDMAEADAIRTTRREIQAFYQQRRFPDAAKAASALTKKYPKSVEAWMILADVHLRSDWPMRKDTRAEQAALRARKLAGPRPDILFAQALAQGRQRSPKALEPVQLLLESHAATMPPDRLATLLHLRATLVLNSDSATEEQRQQAHADLDQAITVLPQAVYLRLERANQRRLQNNYQGALEDLQLVLNREPGSVRVHYELKTCYVALRKMDQARHHLEVWQLLLRLTDSTARTSAPEPSERLEVLRRLREINPADPQRRLDCVAQELEHGDLDRAAKEVVALRRDFPAMAAVAGLEAEIQRRLRVRASDDG